MKTAVPKYMWMLMALLVLFQASMPTLVMADLIMRCAGQSAPCSHVSMSLLQPKSADQMAALMPCCKGMAQAAMVAPPAVGSPSRQTGQVVSGPRCTLTVLYSAANSRQVITSSQYRWMLTASPALAPPSGPDFRLSICLDSSRSFHDVGRNCFSPVFTLSYGLRAPPVS